jgi:hypothetical protein
LETQLPEAKSGVVVLKFVGGLRADWGPVLYYGAGMNPYCNIADEKEIGLPAFGPVPIPYRRE